MLTILQGDVIEQLRALPDESVHCCVTSPPYWGLRDYGTSEWEGGDDSCDHKEYLSPSREKPVERYTAGGAYVYDLPNGRQFWKECGKCGAKRIDSQLGLEKTPEEYVAKMVAVFREVRRVLRKDGTLWLNMGDSYANGLGGPPSSSSTLHGGRGVGSGEKVAQLKPIRKGTAEGLKPKDLCGIPWRLAFALQADGWWLRSDIIWAKPNPMPESVTDRPTKAHEYIFLLTKSANYFYDAEAIKEQAAYDGRQDTTVKPSDKYAGRNLVQGQQPQTLGRGLQQERWPSMLNNGERARNKRTVWTVATAPYPEAHFATYPPDLIKPCILAGTSAKGCCAKCGSPWKRIITVEDPEGRLGKGYHDHKNDLERGQRGVFPAEGRPISKTIGWQPTCDCQIRSSGIQAFVPYPAIPCTVLDPFAGSGTTGAVALELGRKAILIELNPKYVELIKTRCNVTPGLQLA